MRILLDFEMNKEAETYNGIRVTDIAEYKESELVPVWKPGSDAKCLPDYLFINLYGYDEEPDMATKGEYILDGTEETFNKALENYNKVANQLLINGYAKISDFKNVEWL